VIGIDPGKMGAVASIDHGVLRVWKMPDTPGGLAALLERLDGPVVVELVGSGGNANKEGRRMGATSAFTFGCGFGVILGVLAGTGRVAELVRPPKWTRAMGLRGATKHAHTELARRLYPTCQLNGADKPKRITHYAADAVLLAEYGRQLRGDR